MTIPSRTLKRLAFLAALALSLVILAAPASATASTATWDSPGAGWAGIYNGDDAGIQQFQIEGGTIVPAFCVQEAITMNTSATFTGQSLDSQGIANSGGAAWLAANHQAVPTPAVNANDEAAATQVAIWNLTDSITINSTTVPNATIRARALQLVAAVGTNTIDASPASFALSETAISSGTNATLTATLTTDAAAPIAGETISFTYSGGTQDVVTDASGIATAAIAYPTDGNLATTATWSGTLAAGTLLVPTDSSQIFVTAGPADISRAAAADIPVVTPPTTTPPTTTPTTPTTPTEATPSGSLPFTGGTLTIWHFLLGIGVAGLAAFGLRRSLRAR